MVPLCHHQPSLSAKPLYSPIFSPFSIPRTFVFQNPNRSKSQIRSSTSADTKTLQSSAIQRIAEKLRSLGFSEEDSTPKSLESSEPAGEIFVPLPNQLPRYRVGHTIDTSWSTPDFPVPEPGSGRVISRYQELRRAWKKEVELERTKQEKVPTLAELTLSASELRRLRKIGVELKKKLKIGKAGITEGIVNGIHERWRNSEVVKIFCEDISMMNMKRTHEVLEKKTGGLVIWRSGSKILLYRGPNYQYPYFDSGSNPAKEGSSNATSEIWDEEADDFKSMDNPDSSETSPTNITGKPAIIYGVGSRNKVRFQLPGEAQMVEEADKLLEGLGPRFTDWWAYDPLPVDADLLPAIIPGYRRPFRLLPYGVSPKLTGDEMTILRRLGRPLPCHFALGRNRKLHGLAAAIVKLWEKCEIAKIAVKRGVQNTNSDMMAEELKWLTGGTLLSRDKDFIVLYRGKDFLPSAVSSAIEERRKHLIGREEQKSADLDTPSIKKEEPKLGDSVNDSPEEVIESDNDINRTSKPKSLSSPEAAIERTSFKLSMALEKKAKAEKLLAELEQQETPKQSDVDREGINKEERFMLRKVGLRMKPFLLLGRRGVFDGTIENMHLHWKYRELVKIICKEESAEESRRVARILESESGGILVAVERVSKGYAIIVYRGKNYERPASLRPRTLLSKREAMKRSLEAQRRKSLKLHVLKLARSIDQLNRQLVKDDNMDGDMQLNVDSRIGLDITETEGGFTDRNIEVVDEDKSDSTSQEDEMGLGVSAEHDSDAGDSSGYTDGSEESDCDDTGSCQSSAGIILSVGNKSAEILSQGGTGCNDDINAEHCDPASRVLKLSEQQTKSESPISGVGSVSNETGSLHLSNRQRLILRKQALKMKKRPPLSVGRSNIVTGLAKAIATHFQKYPLAIVNVKGRAKGTSVQEVVSKLTEATGAFLVSQEPSKVILYRGWGAGIENSYNNNIRNTINLTSEDRDVKVFPPVSSELMEAIRIECGLLDHHDKDTT